MLLLCAAVSLARHQVLPVVMRLCAPIEGTNASHLAQCLGLDASRYGHSGSSGAHTSLAAALREEALQVRVWGGEGGAWVWECVGVGGTGGVWVQRQGMCRLRRGSGGGHKFHSRGHGRRVCSNGVNRDARGLCAHLCLRVV